MSDMPIDTVELMTSIIILVMSYFGIDLARKKRRKRKGP